MTREHEPEAAPPSKSARKREHLARQALGETLVRLTPGQRARVPLGETVRGAVEDARGMRGGAFRRQVRYIGRLIGEDDETGIRAAVDGLRHARAADTAPVRRAERWRERLIEEGDAALEALLDAYPDADRQHLRRAHRAARSERETGRPAGAARALFRALRDLEGRSSTDD